MKTKEINCCVDVNDAVRLQISGFLSDNKIIFIGLWSAKPLTENGLHANHLQSSTVPRCVFQNIRRHRYNMNGKRQYKEAEQFVTKLLQ